MRWLKRLVIVLTVLVVLYSLGPTPATPNYGTKMPDVPSIDQLENYITGQESAHRLRPDNEARVVWANDSIKQKTEYAIVYLHGFSACQEEGNPVHRNIAKQFGCNLFLARLAEHGMDTADQLLNLTAENYWKSAQQALAIGKQLGNKVILMGTSTGGTQALQLAATYPNDVAALVLYSPNIAINDSKAWLLNNPWGLQIARLVKGTKYMVADDTRPIYRQYWDRPYRLEATIALEEMLETTMSKETFSKVKQPTLLLYYYKDEQHQDSIVKVSAMKEMFAQLSTKDSEKRAVALPLSENHVIASPIKSKDVAGVERETKSFLEQVVHLQLNN